MLLNPTESAASAASAKELKAICDETCENFQGYFYPIKAMSSSPFACQSNGTVSDDGCERRKRKFPKEGENWIEITTEV